MTLILLHPVQSLTGAPNSRSVRDKRIRKVNELVVAKIKAQVRGIISAAGSQLSARETERRAGRLQTCTAGLSVLQRA